MRNSFPCHYTVSLLLRSIGATGLIALTTAAALAQNKAEDYPARQVNIVIPVQAGSSADAGARYWAKVLTESLGKPFVLDFKPGAGGIIGADHVAKARPDGHTLMFISGSFVTLAAFNSSLPFDSVKSFAPVTQMTKRGLVLVVHPSVPVNSFKEYLAYAKASPAGVNFGTTGPGSSFHLAGALLSIETGTKAAFIHYKGSAPMYIDLVAGRVQVSPMTTWGALPYIKSGKVRPIVQLGQQRSSFLPDIPAISEYGISNIDLSSWTGLLTTGGTPIAVLAKLHAAIASHAKSAEVIGQFNKQGEELVASPPEAFRQYIASEVPRWQKVVRDNNIELQD